MSNFLINSFPFKTPGPGDGAQNFDGSDDYFEVLTDWYQADTEDGIMSVWFRRDSTGGNHAIITGNNNRHSFLIQSDDSIRVLLNTSSGSTLLDINSGATTITDTNWHHLLVSWELDSTPTSFMYIDDVDVKSVVTETNGAVDWTLTRNRVGANGAVTAGLFFDGCLAELYVSISAGINLDFSVTANRRKFISALGNPVDLGSDGSTPTAAQPQVYLPGPDFTDNKGSKANPSSSGSPVACSNSPRP